jgi:hypothetical protein
LILPDYFAFSGSFVQNGISSANRASRAFAQRASIALRRRFRRIIL